MFIVLIATGNNGLIKGPVDSMHFGLHLYLTSKRVESSSSSFSSFRGAISTRSAGVVMMSYFRVFLILLPDLSTLMTKHEMRTAVNTKIKITLFFSVGRCVNIEDIRDSVVVLVPFLDKSTSCKDNVELACVAGEGIACGSQTTSQNTTIINEKNKL